MGFIWHDVLITIERQNNPCAKTMKQISGGGGYFYKKSEHRAVLLLKKISPVNIKINNP
jgi:hypothetical protein